MAQEAVITVRGLTKIFKDFWGRPKVTAVDHIDFDVYKGQICGFLGPNGSGKSTTVKILLGLLFPTRGIVTVLEASPRDVRTKARIGFLPEETTLYPHLTAQEILMFFGSLFRLSRKQCLLRTEQLLNMVGLYHARNRLLREFSKGMARRIGLAQALINDPDLVILDEPTAGLDPIGRREVKDLIGALAARGKTVLLCSHLLADVEDVCDSVSVLYKGKIQAKGSIRDLLSRPDAVRITTPLLSQQVMDSVIQSIEAEVGSGKIQIDVPTQNLESFFLDVVGKARGEDQKSDGKTSQEGHATHPPIAQYLVGDIAERDKALLARYVRDPGSDRADGQAQKASEASPTAQQEEKIQHLVVQDETEQGSDSSEGQTDEDDTAGSDDFLRKFTDEEK